MLIRRSFKGDEVYKLVVREYLRYLVAAGGNLEWYMEGGRSRTGKLRPPKYGLLRYLVDAIEGHAAEDLMLVPVSITYDQLHEVGVMAAEEAGTTKAKEGVRWLMDYAKTQKEWIGKAYVRFGTPLSLRGALIDSDSGKTGGRWALDKVAFEVFQRINRVTPVTAPALVTLALLGAHDRALTLNEIHGVVEPLLEYASRRGLPTTAVSGLVEKQGVDDVLNALVRTGVITRYDGGVVPVFKIEPGKHSVAAFYRNSAIHWFVNRAIIELGVMDATRDAQADSLERGWEAAYALRDLLKFEFFFSDKETFREEIKAEALLVAPNFVENLVSPEARGSILKKCALPDRASGPACLSGSLFHRRRPPHGPAHGRGSGSARLPHRMRFRRQAVRASGQAAQSGMRQQGVVRQRPVPGGEPESPRTRNGKPGRAAAEIRGGNVRRRGGCRRHRKIRSTNACRRAGAILMTTTQETVRHDPRRPRGPRSRHSSISTAP